MPITLPLLKVRDIWMQASAQLYLLRFVRQGQYCPNPWPGYNKLHTINHATTYNPRRPLFRDFKLWLTIHLALIGVSLYLHYHFIILSIVGVDLLLLSLLWLMIIKIFSLHYKIFMIITVFMILDNQNLDKHCKAYDNSSITGNIPHQKYM